MNTDNTLNFEYQIVNNAEKLIFQVSIDQWKISIEKNNKGGKIGGGLVLLSPQPNNCIYYNKNISKIEDIACGFCLLYTNSTSFCFYFSMGHDQASIFGHW
jgi:hypothetical protein